MPQYSYLCSNCEDKITTARVAPPLGDVEARATAANIRQSPRWRTHAEGANITVSASIEGESYEQK